MLTSAEKYAETVLVELSTEQLLAREIVLKEALRVVDADQAILLHVSYVAKRKRLDTQIQSVITELERRDSPDSGA